MFQEKIYTVNSPYRESMVIRGYSFGKGDPAACILGSERGNEVQQMYICSQLVKALKELEANGCVNAGKKILVIPVINALGMNVDRRFFGVENQDINRMFPGKEHGDTTDRIADGIFKVIKEYSYGIQLTSFYMSGEFVPHVRMMETGYQNASLANLFGLPYVVIRKPTPLDTKTLNYNWQDEMTAAFSVYTNKNDTIDDRSARQAVASVLRFLTRMGIIRYESHSGYISHVIMEKDLTDVHTLSGGIFKGLVSPGEDVRYGHALAEIIDPYEGFVKETLLAPTDGIVFFAHTEPLIAEGAIAYRLIHRLHE
ncbi:MAG: M14 family metallopeptidase [Lachnospiraceae bacterium]|nr:M14 family metallopeptidase [Lachnospiraceae bacterium]MCI7191120.1 M14 family metallopeptidase [Lachnospiraceae bacterium]MDD7628042.1 M14 family metallopeptidase [Lachnospiraceae bacterium]MDY4119825.1 M14 family metallopeptidase [Lachnospiraceae bacterium]